MTTLSTSEHFLGVLRDELAWPALEWTDELAGVVDDLALHRLEMTLSSMLGAPLPLGWIFDRETAEEIFREYCVASIAIGFS